MAPDLNLAATKLLTLMSGAWMTQALAVAADLRLADHLADRISTRELANRVLADHSSLTRLLRYLASAGVVKTVGNRFELTEIGQLLRTDSAHSMRPLASLYGGTFYRSFAELGQAVRTGHDSFTSVFGQHHFDYFADRPELCFAEAMAASATMFGAVAEIVDFTGVHVVVDVAGGNGELLKHILHAVPEVRGVVFERPHAIPAAESNLAEYRARCNFIAGDFTCGVPDMGDVYLLSRVLHDWDDQQCKTILQQCSAAMRAGSQLIVVERLLPDDDLPSLAAAWDIHMLCNVGGRERTADDYRALFEAADLTIHAQHELPLGFALLHATRA